jgi:hypothetical protein
MTFKIYLKNGLIAYCNTIKKEDLWLYATGVIIQEGKREPKFIQLPYACFPYVSIIFWGPIDPAEFKAIQEKTKQVIEIPEAKQEAKQAAKEPAEEEPKIPTCQDCKYFDQPRMDKAVGLCGLMKIDLASISGICRFFEKKEKEDKKIPADLL